MLKTERGGYSSKNRLDNETIKSKSGIKSKMGEIYSTIDQDEEQKMTFEGA